MATRFICVKNGCVTVIRGAGISLRGDMFTCGDPLSDASLVWIMRVSSISYDVRSHGEPHAVFDTWLHWFDEGKAGITQTVIFPDPVEYDYEGLLGYFERPQT